PCPTARAQGHLRNCESATYNEARDSEVLPRLASQRPRRSAYEAARMPFRLEPRCQPAQTFFPALIPILERETGIEPATNSLEGCDSTTELLPPKNSH